MSEYVPSPRKIFCSFKPVFNSSAEFSDSIQEAISLFSELTEELSKLEMKYPNARIVSKSGSHCFYVETPIPETDLEMAIRHDRELECFLENQETERNSLKD